MTRMLIRVAALLCLCTAAQAQTLQVLDYGAEPRAPLRYTFTAGHSEKVAMVMSMESKQELNGQAMPGANFPPTRTIMSMRVAEVAADGSARLEITTHSAEADLTQAGDAANQALLGQTLAMESQMKGSYRIDTRGRIIDTSIDLPESANALMSGAGQQVMNDLLGSQNDSVQPLPEQAVGVGARWLVENRIAVAGVEQLVTQEYTLRSRSGDHIELDVQMKQELGNLPAAALAEGMTASSSASGSGHMALDLRRLMPIMSMEVNSVTSIGMPAQQGAAGSMKMTMQMKVSTAPAAD